MIWITQLLCPERHCIFAFVFDENVTTRDIAERDLVAAFQKLVDTHALNPWCALCGSHVIKPESARTKYATMEEALPHIRKSEDANIASRKLLEGLGATYDQQKQKEN